MINKQDSYWTEYTLDEKVDQKVCVYLREHHAEYRNTKQKMKEPIGRATQRNSGNQYHGDVSY